MRNHLDRLEAMLRRHGIRSGHVPGVRTAKTALAAVIAYVIATRVSAEPVPVLAPLTALLVAQVTLYETLTSGARQVVSVVAGVLLALGISQVVGLTWWSLGVLIVLAIVVGRVLDVGEKLMEVPISAMLILAVGGAGQYAAYNRVYETLIGAGVGVLVNVLVAPPLYVRPAGAAIRGVSERMAQVLHRASDDLRDEYSQARAQSWVEDARRIGRDVARAERAVERADRSMQLNPRARRAAHSTPSLHAALTVLEHAAVAVRGVCRALAERAEKAEGGEPYDEQTVSALADVLGAAGDAVDAFGAHVATDALAATGDTAELRERLAVARGASDAAAAALAVDPSRDPALWRLHGALLADVGRLLHELDVEGPSAARDVTRTGPLPRRRPDVAVRSAAQLAREAGVRTRGRVRSRTSQSRRNGSQG